MTAKRKPSDTSNASSPTTAGLRARGILSSCAKRSAAPTLISAAVYAAGTYSQPCILSALEPCLQGRIFKGFATVSASSLSRRASRQRAGGVKIGAIIHTHSQAFDQLAAQPACHQRQYRA